jgi:head-tail adaptor
MSATAEWLKENAREATAGKLLPDERIRLTDLVKVRDAAKRKVEEVEKYHQNLARIESEPFRRERIKAAIAINLIEQTAFLRVLNEEPKP